MRCRRRVGNVLFLVLLASSAPARGGGFAEGKDTLGSAVPTSSLPDGWSLSDSVRIYAGRDLYRFIDGGADLFFEYGFKQAAAAEYQRSTGKSINLEIYEMTDPGAAYGIYSIRSGDESRPVSMGDEGSIHTYYLMARKGRCYVTVAASDSTSECRKALDHIGRRVVDSLPGFGEIPPGAEWLPKEPLRRVRYVRGPLGYSVTRMPELNGLFPVLDAAIGTYRDHSAAVFKYSTATDAEHHLGSVVASLRQYKGYHIEDNMSMAIDVQGRILCAAMAGSRIVLTVSSDAAVAEASCRNIVLQMPPE